MQGISTVKKSIITAICLALCVVLPQIFHAIPDGGAIYCPIHIPVLLCGLICGWQYGILTGLVGPALSSLLTGMPTFVQLPPMMVECAVYGLITGLLMLLVHTKKAPADVYIALIAAMIVGRVASGAARALIFSSGTEYTIKIWAVTYFITSIPGIVIQLILIPALIAALIRSGLIPPRYEPEIQYEDTEEEEEDDFFR